MNAAEKTQYHLVTLHAQPYDVEARGFYFHSLEEYEEKADKNLNSWGGKVEEYEMQFIDGEGDQELLDRLPLAEFFEIVETWKSEDIEKIHLLAEAVGWHYIASTASELEDQIQDLIVYTSTHSKDDLGAEVMEAQDPEAYEKIRPYHHYFAFDRWLDDQLCGSSAITFYRDGKHYFIEYIG